MPLVGQQCVNMAFPCHIHLNTFFIFAKKDFFMDLGRSVHYFKEARDHRSPLGALSLMFQTNSLSVFNSDW